MNTTPADRLIRVGLWALPAYGLLIMVTTLTPQPDQASDPGVGPDSSAARPIWSDTSPATSWGPSS